MKTSGARAFFSVAAFGGILAACSAGWSEPVDAEHDPDAEGVLSEDGLTQRKVADYAAVFPPQARVASANIPARFGPAVGTGRKVAILRTASVEGESVRLVVDLDSYATSLVAASALERRSRPAEATDNAAATPYMRSLKGLAESERALTEVSADAPNRGANEPFAVTIDMCQSKKPWERRLFDWAIDLSNTLGRPVPVGIAMTGIWATTHPDEFEQLLAWEKAEKLQITWINHSHTHPLHCTEPSCRQATFLTHPSVDFEAEVLGEERILLARGATPAVFFRFPGLAHNSKRMRQLSKLSLLPLDANGWIAKGEPIKPRAVVLLHGNGNEPEGTTEFLRQVGTSARSSRLRSGMSALVPAAFAAPFPPK